MGAAGDELHVGGRALAACGVAPPASPASAASPQLAHAPVQALPHAAACAFAAAPRARMPDVTAAGTPAFACAACMSDAPLAARAASPDSEAKGQRASPLPCTAPSPAPVPFTSVASFPRLQSLESLRRRHRQYAEGGGAREHHAGNDTCQRHCTARAVEAE